MKKIFYISAIILVSCLTITSCEKENEEIPISENVSFMRYKMPEPTPLNGDEQNTIEEISKEHNQNIKK